MKSRLMMILWKGAWSMLEDFKDIHILSWKATKDCLQKAETLQTGETESESFISYDSRIGIHREDLAISNIC